ncbi:MAG: OB-fold domain-containing protein [Trebonia sp.]
MRGASAGPADAIQAAAARVAAAGESSPRAGRDPVNLPMIRNWIEAIGDDNPVYTDEGLAPPAMIQVWTMPGLHGARTDDDPLGLMSSVLDDAGYTSVVATNCDQEYFRYPRHGERLAVRTSLVDVVGPKRTGLGEGWFVTTRSTWYSGDEPVATMDFRILKFRPGTAASGPAAGPGPGPGEVMRPQVTQDTAFFWEGTASRELRIQRCAKCGTLRHPPGPMCPKCGTPADGGYTVASGAGTVYSYVVHRHPPVPGKRLPMVIALVELPEGVRVLGELHGVQPERVGIGMPVRAAFDRIDDDLTLPAWRPAPPGEPLPDLVIRATPTFVISSALATRDFQDVHHDRDLAVARGSRDIFVNILTTTGLVQRFVAGWAGPRAVFKSIAIRLGAPCYAGDTLVFTGGATEADDGSGDWLVTVTGRCALGDHVTGTVRITSVGSPR